MLNSYDFSTLKQDVQFSEKQGKDKEAAPDYESVDDLDKPVILDENLAESENSSLSIEEIKESTIINSNNCPAIIADKSDSVRLKKQKILRNVINDHKVSLFKRIRYLGSCCFNCTNKQRCRADPLLQCLGKCCKGIAETSQGAGVESPADIPIFTGVEPPAPAEVKQVIEVKVTYHKKYKRNELTWKDNYKSEKSGFCEQKLRVDISWLKLILIQECLKITNPGMFIEALNKYEDSRECITLEEYVTINKVTPYQLELLGLLKKSNLKVLATKADSNCMYHAIKALALLGKGEIPLGGDKRIRDKGIVCE